MIFQNPVTYFENQSLMNAIFDTLIFMSKYDTEFLRITHTCVCVHEIIRISEFGGILFRAKKKQSLKIFLEI